MSVDTKARLRGNVSPDDIISFVKEKFGWRVRTGLTTSNYEIPDSGVYENYTNSPTWDTLSGFIDLIVDDTGEKNRSIFYCKSNLNFHENYDYYSENNPELIEMVCAETTYISLGHNEQAIEIIGAIVDEFGGWFCENDHSGEFYNVIGRREKEQDFSNVDFEKSKENIAKRIDIMTDIETLGRGKNAPVFQISAVKFNIQTGEILDTFNQVVDISKLSNIEGDTLIWWLNTNKELLTELLNKGKHCGLSEKQVVENFVAWVKATVDGCNVPKQEDIFLWGNGILFDNRIIQEKCVQYGLEYPIFYRNDRDIRTIVELAAYKTGFPNSNSYQKSFPNYGTLHDAFDDVKHQIKVVCKAFSVIQN